MHLPSPASAGLHQPPGGWWLLRQRSPTTDDGAVSELVWRNGLGAEIGTVQSGSCRPHEHSHLACVKRTLLVLAMGGFLFTFTVDLCVSL